MSSKCNNMSALSSFCVHFLREREVMRNKNKITKKYKITKI